MSRCRVGDVTRLLGKDGLKGSSLVSEEGDTVHFMVAQRKQKNYLQYCAAIEPVHDAVRSINEYTDHTTELYARVNIALAADSENLRNYENFVPQLRAAISATPLYHDGILYRGIDLSAQELEQMERLQRFFIPSFTSTSMDRAKAYKKPCMMLIKVPYACQYACSITEHLSRFHAEEQEVLLSCYTAFRLEKVEMDNNTRMVHMYLDEHSTALRSL